jgi:hypothetical protein
VRSRPARLGVGGSRLCACGCLDCSGPHRARTDLSSAHDGLAAAGCLHAPPLPAVRPLAAGDHGARNDDQPEHRAAAGIPGLHIRSAQEAVPAPQAQARRRLGAAAVAAAQSAAAGCACCLAACWQGGPWCHAPDSAACLALPCLALPCLALPCLALPCRRAWIPESRDSAFNLPAARRPAAARLRPGLRWRAGVAELGQADGRGRGGGRGGAAGPAGGAGGWRRQERAAGGGPWVGLGWLRWPGPLASVGPTNHSAGTVCTAWRRSCKRAAHGGSVRVASCPRDEPTRRRRLLPSEEEEEAAAKEGELQGPPGRGRGPAAGKVLGPALAVPRKVGAKVVGGVVEQVWRMALGRAARALGAF